MGERLSPGGNPYPLCFGPAGVLEGQAARGGGSWIAVSDSATNLSEEECGGRGKSGRGLSSVRDSSMSCVEVWGRKDKCEESWSKGSCRDKEECSWQVFLLLCWI